MKIIAGLFLRLIRKVVFSRSEDATFSTGDKSLALTLPIAPKPGVEEVAISNAVFSWEIDGNSEGLSYRFTLATDDQMNNIVFEQVLTQTNLELTQDLLGNKEYFWRVDVIRRFGDAGRNLVLQKRKSSTEST